VAARVRALCELGVAEVVVLERGPGEELDAAVAADAHTAAVRVAAHFGVPVTLAALDGRVPAEALGYERWVSPAGGSGGWVLAPATWLDTTDPPPAGASRVVTEYLGRDVRPAAVRVAAGALRER
jgi:hypothetical protein